MGLKLNNKSYQNIQSVKLPSDILSQTRDLLRKAGTRREEAFVLWAGYFESVATFSITSAIYPEQKSIRSSAGIGVYVDGNELFKINKWLYENKRVLLGQIHSHPTHAFHSGTDDTFPMVTAIGQFSVVVPFFAREPLLDLSNCAVYRLAQSSRWAAVSKEEVGRMFKVVGNGAR